MSWHFVANLNDLLEESSVAGTAGTTPVAVYHVDGKFYATHNICTHAHACMSDGYLEGFLIECPLHQAQFDVRTGKVMCGPADQDLQAFPVRIEDGLVFVDV